MELWKYVWELKKDDKNRLSAHEVSILKRAVAYSHANEFFVKCHHRENSCAGKFIRTQRSREMRKQTVDVKKLIN